jgi:hypothetical protein
MKRRSTVSLLLKRFLLQGTERPAQPCYTQPYIGEDCKISNSGRHVDGANHEAKICVSTADLVVMIHVTDEDVTAMRKFTRFPPRVFGNWTGSVVRTF